MSILIAVYAVGVAMGEDVFHLGIEGLIRNEVGEVLLLQV